MKFDSITSIISNGGRSGGAKISGKEKKSKETKLTNDTVATPIFGVETNEDTDDNSADDEIDAETEARMNKVVRKNRCSVSAEVYGEWNKRKEFNAPVHEKSEESKRNICAILKESFLFSALDSYDIDTVVNAFEEIKPCNNTVIIKQGDDGDQLYLIQTGLVKVYKNQRIDNTEEFEEKFICDMNPGDAFGELALMYNAPRAATVIAATDDLQLWALNRECFNHIVKDAAAKKRAMYETVLGEIPILKDVDAYERSKISDALTDERFQQGQHIINQGEAGDTFYILLEGNAVAEKDGKKILDYSKGSYFGELALLFNQPRVATIRATSDCRVTSLGRKAFQRLLGPLESVLMRNVDNYKKILTELGFDPNLVDKQKQQN